MIEVYLQEAFLREPDANARRAALHYEALRELELRRASARHDAIRGLFKAISSLRLRPTPPNGGETA